MDFNTVLSAISAVGLLFFALTNKNYRDDLKEQNANHKEETKNLVDAINNNSMVIQRLIDKE